MAHATAEMERSRPSVLDVWAPKIGDPFSLMSFLLAFGVLNHVHTIRDFGPILTNPSIAAMVVAASALLIRPSSRWLFVVLNATLAFELVTKMRGVNNHLVAFGLLGAALVALRIMATRYSDEEGEPFFLASAFHAGSFSIVTVWFLAALHKLNTGFLDTVHSCAVSHGNDLVELVGLGRPIEGGGVAGVLIVTTLVAEVGIPILLILRRWRTLGLVGAFIFHMVMAINGHQAFSGFALAMYVPFLPESLFRGWSVDDLQRRVAWSVVKACGLFLAAFGFLLNITGTSYSHLEIRRLFYVLAALAVVSVVLQAWRREGVQKGDRSVAATSMDAINRDQRRTIRIATAVVVALLVANGLAPYIGLKTTLSFSMYSNLRTETTEDWNHLFVPEQVQILGNANELVEVISINHPDSGRPRGTDHQ